MTTLSESARTYNMDAANTRLEAERKVPKRSPWGAVDGHSVLAPGIVSVRTPSHGGIHLDRWHLNMMRRLFPDWPRLNTPWFEEDCDWSVPFVVFCGEILEYLQAQGPSWELEHYADSLNHARNAWRNWLPEAWERYYGVTLDPSESYIRRQQQVPTVSRDLVADPALADILAGEGGAS